MKLQYFSDTDTLAISLSDNPSTTTNAVTDDVILDFDENGKVVGITVDHYSQNVESTMVQFIDMPDFEVANLNTLSTQNPS